MTHDTAADAMDQAIDEMFEAFSRTTALRQGRTTDLQEWRKRYKPLSFAGREEFNPRDQAHKRFLNNILARHIWTIEEQWEMADTPQGRRRVRKEFWIEPGSSRSPRARQKLCVTLVPWESDDAGMRVTDLAAS